MSAREEEIIRARESQGCWDFANAICQTHAPKLWVQPTKKGRGRPKSGPKEPERKDAIQNDLVTGNTTAGLHQSGEKGPLPKESVPPVDNDGLEDSPPKKRGRGRPRSVQKTEAKEFEVHQDNIGAAAGVKSNSDTKALDRDALAEVDTNAKVAMETDECPDGKEVVDVS